MPKVFVKQSDSWKQVKLIWTNVSGTWTPINKGTIVDQSAVERRFYPDVPLEPGNNHLDLVVPGVTTNWVVPAGITNISSITLAGGTGGGGGGDGGRSGYESARASRLMFYNIAVVPGEVFTFVPGGGGKGGRGGISGAGGGAGGISSVAPEIFSTRNNPISGTQNYTNGAYTGFLNEYGIWNASGIETTEFNKYVTVNFPVTGSYTFTASCDNYGSIRLDGTEILSPPSYTSNVSTTIAVSAGSHTIQIYGYNTGGPGAIALRIENQSISFAGGAGGDAGPVGSSGGGGGGGAATVMYRNSSLFCVAPGTGGGGGAGLHSNGFWAESSSNYLSVGTSGGNGQDKSGDGGGGGGGGGGYHGGVGGTTRDGDNGAYSGSQGQFLSSGTGDWQGPYGAPGSSGNGADGNNGYVYVVF